MRAYPNSAHTDYVFYLAALSNARLGDNFIQDFFGVNRASRSIDAVRNAYGSFQTIVRDFSKQQICTRSTTMDGLFAKPYGGTRT